jgi:hypothetical protein
MPQFPSCAAISLAVSTISATPLSARETGQASLASAAKRWNCGSSTPGATREFFF